MKRILSGNEAVARGAWEAGCNVGSGYPGTPSTEILETYAKYPHVYAEWAPNEKVAVDVATGAAYAGRRAFATMKHVGLNVAMDSFYVGANTGAEAGLVVVSADDPSMHSSQNEQDNRRLAMFARVPCLDPADSQEAKDYTIAAFEISEQFDTIAMLRMTTRVCHTSGLVEVAEERQSLNEPGKYVRNIPKYCMAPAFARARHPIIEQRVSLMKTFAEETILNRVELRSSDLGIITGGVAYQYAREVFPDASIFKLGLVYPLPEKKIKAFAAQMKKVIIMEELDPVIEEQVRLMGVELFRGEEIEHNGGKAIFPICYEFNQSLVRQSAIEAGLLPKDEQVAQPEPLNDVQLIPQRHSVLCPGCPHRTTAYVLSKLKVPVNGDIGCYALGMADPMNSVHTVGCMGASIATAHGAMVAGDTERHVAIIGDSTFFHTGIPALIDVVYNQSNVITIIMDNRTTGMTGHQENPGTGFTLQGKETYRIDLEQLVRELGIKHVKTVPALKVKEIEKILKEYLEIDEPSVLITEEPCALLPERKKAYLPLQVTDKCNGCTACFRIGCPAITQSGQMDPKYNRPLAEIDPQQCTGCEICAQVCPRDAILFRDQVLSQSGKA
ncbi:MAG: indolepyruvate ferredoxin oxidoreductase subunit alpha [Anaerolineaceae bacterium]|nr:indolepyruvate ferredoxin oxidoreductase subunit alpha [Anaerolineaceae bacterium]